MMNKNMVLCMYLVMGILLYDLYVDIVWPFNPHRNYIVHIVMVPLFLQ